MDMLRFIAGVTLGLWAAGAVAQGWDARIAAAYATEAEIVALADGFDRDYNMLGTFIRHADTANIRCSIAAELLGIGDISDHLDYYNHNPLEPVAIPDAGAIRDVQAVDDLLGKALALRGWAYLAEQMRTQSEHQRAEFWALSCDGQHGIPRGLLAAERDRGAQFRVEGHALWVLGDIVPGFFDAFKAVLAENPGVTTVRLGSRGGSVNDAMMAGGLIRSKGLYVDLYGDCASACPLILFASPEPRIWNAQPYFRLGFHQISSGGAAIPLDHEIYEAVGAYVEAMGVSADFVLTAMQDTPPENMYYPRLEYLCDAGVAVWIKNFCGTPPG